MSSYIARSSDATNVPLDKVDAKAPISFSQVADNDYLKTLLTAPTSTAAQYLPGLEISGANVNASDSSATTNDGSSAPGVLQNDQHQVTSVTYKDGTSRQFQYDGTQLSSITDTDGQVYTHTQDGRWLRPDGSDTGNKDATVLPDGTYAFLDASGKYQSYMPNGEHKTITLPKDVQPYPDDSQKAAESQRIAQLVDGHLTAAGQQIVSDTTKLGVSDIDLWHGVYTTENDNGQLYARWSQLAAAEKRPSSSHGDTSKQQYQIKMGPGNSYLLFGLDNNGNTFFQLERDGDSNLNGDNGVGAVNWLARKATDAAPHIGLGGTFVESAHDHDGDYYAETHQGIGPFGLSPFQQTLDTWTDLGAIPPDLMQK